MTNNFDIFISYKRKSLPTANNLYYRLTTRGYSTFFDLEEMGRDNFNTQLLKYIENAKDVFVILEEGSLDACKKEDWEKDWFCHEIAFALEKKKNIIPILLNGYKMPSQDFFPDKLKELSLKNAPEFNYSFFEAYLDKLIEKEYLLSKPNLQDKATSVFKFYSNENCQVFKEGKLVCSLDGMSDAPYYLPVPRKGDYRFKVTNASTGESQIINEVIDAVEEKGVEITWKHNPKIGLLFSKSLKWIITFIALSLLGLVLFKLSSHTGGDVRTVEETDTIVKPTIVTERECTNTYWGDYFYTGPVDEKGLPHGNGKAVMKKTGECYVGPFSHGIAEGDSCIYTWPTGEIRKFVGRFKDGAPVEGYCISEKGESNVFYNK